MMEMGPEQVNHNVQALKNVGFNPSYDGNGAGTQFTTLQAASVPVFQSFL